MSSSQDSQHLAEILARQKRILVVDDDHLIRLVFDQLEREFDLPIRCVASGPEALSELRHHEYGIVFLDMKLGGTDGMDVLREVVSLPQDIHVVIMSASINMHEIMGEANRLGVLSFLLKPVAFDRDYVIHILKKLGVRLVSRQQ